MCWGGGCSVSTEGDQPLTVCVSLGDADAKGPWFPMLSGSLCDWSSTLREELE